MPDANKCKREYRDFIENLLPKYVDIEFYIIYEDVLHRSKLGHKSYKYSLSEHIPKHLRKEAERLIFDKFRDEGFQIYVEDEKIFTIKWSDD